MTAPVVSYTEVNSVHFLEHRKWDINMNRTFKIICISPDYCCCYYYFLFIHLHFGCSIYSYGAWYNGEHEMSLSINQIDSRAFVVRARGHIIHFLFFLMHAKTSFLLDSNRLRAIKIEVFVCAVLHSSSILCKFVQIVLSYLS